MSSEGIIRDSWINLSTKIFYHSSIYTIWSHKLIFLHPGWIAGHIVVGLVHDQPGQANIQRASISLNPPPHTPMQSHTVRGDPATWQARPWPSRQLWSSLLKDHLWPPLAAGQRENPPGWLWRPFIIEPHPTRKSLLPTSSLSHWHTCLSFPCSPT